MSYDNCMGMYTEDEILAGIPGLMRSNGYDDDDCEDKDEFYKPEFLQHSTQNYFDVHKNEIYDNQRRKEAIKLIAGLSNAEEIQNMIIQKLLLDDLDYMANRYAKRESLPIEYVNVAKQKNGLEILIKNYLKKIGGYALTAELIDEIDVLIKGIYANTELAIVYERVAKIQQFIHRKIDAKDGEDSHLNLPIKQIRNILSAARLHLNIYDIKYSKDNSLVYLIEKSNNASDAEVKNPQKINLPPGKKYIKHWRVRNLKALTYINTREVRFKLKALLKIDKELPLDIFIKLALDIFSYKEYGRMPGWV